MLLTIVIFIIVLAALIFVHELGHFIAARSFGIRVDEFALVLVRVCLSTKLTAAVFGARLLMPSMPFRLADL